MGENKLLLQHYWLWEWVSSQDLCAIDFSEPEKADSETEDGQAIAAGTWLNVRSIRYAKMK